MYAQQWIYKGERRGGTNWDISIDICALPCVKQIASGELAIKHRKLSSILRDDLNGWDVGLGGGGREVQGGREYMYIYVVDSLYCTVETSTTSLRTML